MASHGVCHPGGYQVCQPSLRHALASVLSSAFPCSLWLLSSFLSPKRLYYLDFWTPRSPPHSAMYSGCGQIRLPHTTLPSGDTLLQNLQRALISRAGNSLLLFCRAQCPACSFHDPQNLAPPVIRTPPLGSASLPLVPQTHVTHTCSWSLFTSVRLSACVESLLRFHHTFHSHLLSKILLCPTSGPVQPSFLLIPETLMFFYCGVERLITFWLNYILWFPLCQYLASPVLGTWRAVNNF